MSNVDFSRLIRLIVAGAAGGFVTFLVLNPSYAYEEMTGHEGGSAYASALLLFASFAALVAGVVVLADEIGSPAKRVLTRMGIAAAAGLVAGGISGLIAQSVYGAMLKDVEPGLQAIPTLVFARTIGWGIAGAGSGSGVGIAWRSARRVLLCAIGGLIGGLIGGFMFDTLPMFLFSMATGSVSRFFGFTIMGATIGAAISLVEDVAKQSWVTILSGPKEGRSFILSKALTTIGRDEMADIPLFGDQSVVKQHAALRMDGQSVAIQAGAGAQVTVNGAPTPYAELRDSDVVHIGRIMMRFHQKATQGAAAVSPTQWSTPYGGPAQPPVPVPPQAMAAPTGRLVMSATTGPHAGGSYNFDSGPIKIGRDVGCQIVLSMDSMASRAHAELGRAGSSWVVTDLGSTNGTYVNGVRINQQPLNVGDVVSVGQTAFRVDGI